MRLLPLNAGAAADRFLRHGTIQAARLSAVITLAYNRDSLRSPAGF